MKATRVEVHCFKKDHEDFHALDLACFRSKNVYNSANFNIRQAYIYASRFARGIALNDEGKQFLVMINEKVDEYNVFKKKQCKKSGKKFKKHLYFGKNLKTINYDFLYFLLKKTEAYAGLNAQVSQQTLRLVIKNWLSYHRSIQEWIKEPEKFNGKPKMPRYKDKIDGRSTVIVTKQHFTKTDKNISLSDNLGNVRVITTINEPCQIRINPKGGFYTLEVVYKKEVPKTRKTKNVIGIDLGVNNLVTMVNNIGLQPVVVKGEVIKAYNQYYNKRTAHYKSILEKELGRKTSNRLENLNRKDTFLLKISCIKQVILSLSIALTTTLTQ